MGMDGPDLHSDAGATRAPARRLRSQTAARLGPNHRTKNERRAALACSLLSGPSFASIPPVPAPRTARLVTKISGESRRVLNALPSGPVAQAQSAYRRNRALAGARLKAVDATPDPSTTQEHSMANRERVKGPECSGPPAGLRDGRAYDRTRVQRRASRGLPRRRTARPLRSTRRRRRMQGGHRHRRTRRLVDLGAVKCAPDA